MAKEFKKTVNYHMASPAIDTEKCIGCKRCYDICPQDCFTWNEETNKPEATYRHECWYCGVCWYECPKRCIDVHFTASMYL